jgi:hypothetical protein
LVAGDAALDHEGAEFVALGVVADEVGFFGLEAAAEEEGGGEEEEQGEKRGETAGESHGASVDVWSVRDNQIVTEVEKGGSGADALVGVSERELCSLNAVVAVGANADEGVGTTFWHHFFYCGSWKMS